MGLAEKKEKETNVKEIKNAVSNNKILEIRVSAEKMLELTRKMYQHNFFMLWVREVLQNSVDAHAKNVWITNESWYDEKHKNVTKLCVKDNGDGMDMEIAQNHFCTIGNSYKTKEDAGGGFAIAQAIVRFGNRKGPTPYRDVEVDWYVKTTKRVNGQNQTIYFDSETIGREPIRILETEEETGTEIVIYRSEYCHDYKIEEPLENSNVDAELYYNGREIIQTTRARLKAELSWGKVYYKKNTTPHNHQKGMLIVRINGLYQFSEHITSRMPGVAILEIETRRRRLNLKGEEVYVVKPSDDDYPLTPNREQIKEEYNYRKELNAVLENFKAPEIIKEDQEPFILETIHNPNYDASQEEEIEINEAKRKEQGMKMRNLTEEEHEEEERWREGFEYEQDRIRKVEEQFRDTVLDEFGDDHSDYIREKTEAARKRAQMAKVQEVWRDLSMPHIYFEGSDAIRPEYITEINRQQEFDVQIPSVTIKRDRGFKSQIDLFNRKNLKMLFAFQQLVNATFELAKDKIYKFEYHLGFTLTESARAEYLYKNGEQYILLNPSGLSSTNADLFFDNVIQRTVHEILHHENSWHDEYFIAKFHAIMEECINPNRRELIRMVRKILKG